MGRVLAEALGEAAPTLRVTRALAAGLGVSVLLACAARDELAAGSIVAVPLAGPALHRQLWAVLPADLPRRAPAHMVLERVRTGG
jgi:DNA-binding transcriptional LysR family regulator